MNTVNHCLIESALGYLMIAEAEKGEPLNLAPDDPKIKEAFEKYVKPETDRWSENRLKRLMLSLAYFDNKPNVLSDDVLGNIQDLAMLEPSDIRQFFRWFYEVLFPDQPLEDVDISNVEEDNDIMQMNFEPGELK